MLNIHFASYFAEPNWLWALLLIPLAWGWSWYKRAVKASIKNLEQFVDPKLLPHILLDPGNKAVRRHVGLLYSLLMLCIIIALANPRWSYKDIDAFQSTASMVILLDLSNTMNATDVSPSRIVRARQNIEDLLNLSKALKIGFIGFAGYPHLISPITDDIQTIKTYIPALDTDLTNVQGDSLHAAFKMAAGLLGSEPGDNKSILLVSDGNFVSDDFSHELNALGGQNIKVHVLGVGTAAGAPYKTNSGALQKYQGKTIMSKLNADLLKNIARLGHGIYTEAGITDLGLRAILQKAEEKQEDHVAAGKIRQWDDRYYWFLIPAAALLLYLMRSRILYSFVIGTCLVSITLPKPAYAMELKNAFLNSEQIGQDIYKDGYFKQAAEAFKDPYHKGVALYRAGDFGAAEESFNQVQRNDVKTSSMYNAGNAQMQQRKWQEAIKSYEDVLKIEPDNFAAQHNLEIARKMLAENKDQEQDSDCECNNKQPSDNGKQASSKQEQQKDQNSSKNQQQNEKNANNNQLQNDQTKQREAEQQQAEQRNAQQGNEQQAQAMQDLTQMSEEDARVEQWLNRIDSDIKVFLKNKFYVEDVLSAQK